MTRSRSEFQLEKGLTLGGHDRRRFSFVHRRFAEFFVVADDVDSAEGPADIDSIPQDSRRRDCLVMYCGIAPLKVRKRIADECWSIISSKQTDLVEGRIGEAWDAIRCIRFLGDAFRADVDALSGFRAELGQVVTRLLEADDPLIAKIGAEAIPLIDEAAQAKAMTIALASESRWVCDTTMNSCRHLGSIDEETDRVTRDYIRRIPLGELFERFGDLDFSLSLSDTHRKQRRALWADLVDGLLLIVGSVAMATWSAAIHPAIPVTAALLTGFMLLLVRDGVSSEQRSLVSRAQMQRSDAEPGERGVSHMLTKPYMTMKKRMAGEDPLRSGLAPK